MAFQGPPASHHQHVLMEYRSGRGCALRHMPLCVISTSTCDHAHCVCWSNQNIKYVRRACYVHAHCLSACRSADEFCQSGLCWNVQDTLGRQTMSMHVACTADIFDISIRPAHTMGMARCGCADDTQSYGRCRSAHPRPDRYSRSTC
eukprot:4684121-Pleurochrysis_carterae.AAC.1